MSASASSVRIEVAGICVQVETSASSFLELAELRYGNFISKRKPDFNLKVKIGNTSSSLAHSHILKDASSSQMEVFKPKYTTTENKNHLILEGDEFRAIIDKAGGMAEVVQPQVLYPFDLSLRALLALKLLESGGFFVHASAVVKKGQVYLFFGPSGSGKTTVADLAGEKTLSDDLIAVRKVRGGYWAFGTPFWQGVNQGAPLKAVFELKKSSQTVLAELKPTQALKSLMKSVECLIDTADYRHFLFEAVTNLVEKVPSYRLSFSLDQPFWPALEKFGALG